MRPKTQEIIQQIKSGVQIFFPEPEFEIILFGSQTGMTSRRPTSKSDFDICIKGQKQLDPVNWLLCEEYFDEIYFPWKVDIVDYWRVTSEFRDVIDKTGIKI